MLGGTAAAFNIGSHFTISGLNALGLSQSETFTVITGGDTFTTSTGYTAVTSVTVEPQAATSGTITMGVGAFVGKGTLLLPALGAMHIRPAKQAAWRYLTVRPSDGKPMSYPAVEFSYIVREERDRDISDLPSASLIYSALREDGSVIETSEPT
jgi:hypothetical protein